MVKPLNLYLKPLAIVDDELSHLRIRTLDETTESVRDLTVLARDNSREHVDLVLESTRVLDLRLLSGSEHVHLSHVG